MRKTIIWYAVPLLITLISACKRETRDDMFNFTSKGENNFSVEDSAIMIPIETITSDYFPCSFCHDDREPNTHRRELVEMHDDIIFDHDSENRWCLACHDTEERDSLRLAGGQLLGFNESYKLCGQCHGPKYRDWRLGIHGKRTGMWNGKKQYYLCVNCHNPHSPKIKSLKPLPPPRKPDSIKIDTIYERYEEKSPSS